MGRRLGQHFLFDPAILDRIVDALDPLPHDEVLEIGPGKGTLTRRLAQRVGLVVAIEKDETLAQELEQEGIERCRVVHADALDVDWNACLVATGPIAATDRGRGRAFKVVGNVPYSITTPLIDKALTEPMPARVVFLLQREVADRLGAMPGTKAYGALSVGVQTAATVERLLAVRAGSFRPPPRVDSTLVRIEPRRDQLVRAEDRSDFRAFVTGLFGQRRRQVLRAARTVTKREPAFVADALTSLDIDPAARPEVLTPHEFVRLFTALRR